MKLIEFTKEVEAKYFQGYNFREAFNRALEAHGIRLS